MLYSTAFHLTIKNVDIVLFYVSKEKFCGFCLYVCSRAYTHSFICGLELQRRRLWLKCAMSQNCQWRVMYKNTFNVLWLELQYVSVCEDCQSVQTWSETKYFSTHNFLVSREVMYSYKHRHAVCYAVVYINNIVACLHEYI